MKTEVERAMKLLAGRVESSITPDAAVKFTQAMCNLAHVLATLNSIDR